MVSSWLALSANVPAGAAARRSPNGTRTAPVINCETAVATGNGNVPDAGAFTRAARFEGNLAKMALNGTCTLSPGGGAGRGAGRAAGAAATGFADGDTGRAAGGETGGGAAGVTAGASASFEKNFLNPPNIVIRFPPI